MTQQRHRSRKPRVVLIIAVPPPYHGVTMANRALFDPVFSEAFDCIVIDTSDTRGLDNLGRLDLTNVALAVSHIAKLAYVCLRHRPEVVYLPISQNALAYLRDGLFILAARLLGGAKVVSHLHGGRFLQFYETSAMPVRLFISTTQKLVHTAIVLGESLTSQVANWVDRIRLIPNGIDMFLDEEPSIKVDASLGVTVVFLSNLLKSKGSVDAVRSARLVKDRLGSRKVEYVFAGSWADDEPAGLSSEEIRAEISQILCEDEMTDAVHFLGTIDGSAKLDLLRRGDLLILPSYSEGQSMVILEAFAAGMPVVASRVGANGETVTDGECGLLCTPGDPQDLADKISMIAADDDMRIRMSRAARARYLERYTGSRYVQRMFDMFNDVVTR